MDLVDVLVLFGFAALASAAVCVLWTWLLKRLPDDRPRMNDADDHDPFADDPTTISPG